MSWRRVVLIVLVGCCLVLGGHTIHSGAPAVAASTANSRTAPYDLTKTFPLGPQRLCCQSQSSSQSQTAAAPPSGGVTPPAGASTSASASGSGSGGSGGITDHGSSGLTVIAFWVILGAVMAGLLAAGITDLRRAHRESAPALPGGMTTAGYLERARAAADAVSGAHRARSAATSEQQRPAAETERAGPAAERQRERAAAETQRERIAQERRGRGRPETVEQLGYRRADLHTPSRVDFNVAVILHERGDVTEAIAAYRRAERRGDPDASFNLGVLLCEAGDLDGAETSWRRSAHHGNARASEDLGFLVRRRRERQPAGPDHEGADR